MENADLAVFMTSGQEMEYVYSTAPKLTQGIANTVDEHFSMCFYH